MVVDEGVLLETSVRPGTGELVAAGEVGEGRGDDADHTRISADTVCDRRLVRNASGVPSPVAGRTNMRIKGWMGRADQTAKVKGMFVKSRRKWPT